MVRRIAAFTVLALCSSGCYADVESFAGAYAKQKCKRLKRCDRGMFVDLHDDDMGECRDNVADDILDRADVAEEIGWEYDQDAGQECIQARKEYRRDCSNDATDEILDACVDVIFDGF